MSENPSYPYAPPREVTRLEDCTFYHTMEIPGYGLVGGEWDLRGGEREYLGRVEFAGKRVLEIGTASGFLCFYMESRGADVVAYDLSDEHSWDVVPFARVDHERFLADRTDHIRRINNGWWLAHRAVKSSARAVYGTVYEVPEAIAPVDVATFGAVLLHVRDPFRALEKALALTRETVVVTERVSLRYSGLQLLPGKLKPTMVFLPDARRARPIESWWLISPEFVRSAIAVLGFERSRVTYHLQRFQGRKSLLYTVVGSRTSGTPRIGTG